MFASSLYPKYRSIVDTAVNVAFIGLVIIYNSLINELIIASIVLNISGILATTTVEITEAVSDTLTITAIDVNNNQTTLEQKVEASIEVFHIIKYHLLYHSYHHLHFNIFIT